MYTVFSGHSSTSPQVTLHFYTEMKYDTDISIHTFQNNLRTFIFQLYSCLCSSYKAIICLSEHWLHSSEGNFLHTMHPDYYVAVECISDHEDSVFLSSKYLRGHGGTAILWHKSLNWLITPVPFPPSDRIVGIHINSLPTNIIVFFVYLPSRSRSTEPFCDIMDLLDSAFTHHPDCIILFMGDFNADPGSLHTPANEQGKILCCYLAC